MFSFQSEKNPKRKSLFEGSALLIAGGIFALLFFFYFFYFNQKDRGGNENPPVVKKESLRVPASDVIREEVNEFLAQFFSTTEVEEKFPFILKAEKFSSDIKKYYTKQADPPYDERNFNSLSLGRAVEIFYAPKNGAPSRPLYLYKTVEGGFKLDWLAFSLQNEKSIPHFVAKKETKGQAFRFIVSEDFYYNYAFLDDDHWRSYCLLSPDKKVELFGFAKRNGQLDKALQRYFYQGRKRAYITLEVAFLEKAQDSSNCVRILHIPTFSWKTPLLDK